MFPVAHLLQRRELNMLWTIAIVLLVLWLVGVVTSITLSGFVHLLLGLAVVLILLQVIQGHRSEM